MAHSSNPSTSSTSRSSVIRSSPNQSERKQYGTVTMRPQFKQLATPASSYVPSAEELDRMERYMKMQERMAQLDSMPRQGHSYGKVTVSGNARAIRGNLYDGSTSPSSFRQHTYGEAIVREGGMIWEGDVSVSAFKRQTSSR